MHSFPARINTLQLMNTSCATYCSENLQAEKRCISTYPPLTVVHRVHSHLLKDNVGAKAQENPNEEEKPISSEGFHSACSDTPGLSLPFYAGFCRFAALPFAGLNPARGQTANGVKLIFPWEKV